MRSVFAVLLLSCACSATAPRVDVRVESRLQAPAPALDPPSVAEEPKVAALLDRALAARDRGDLGAASAAALSAACGRPVTEAELGACPKPTTPEVGSAWFFVGELAFEGLLVLAGGAPTDAYAAAELAYARALAVTPSRAPRAIVQYKLGWTRFRRERYEDALEAFLAVAGERDARGVGDEALEYAAASIAESDWDGDGKPDAVRGFARPEVKALVAGERAELATLYAKVVATLVDGAECADARDALAAMSARFPRDPRLPALAASLARCP